MGKGVAALLILLFLIPAAYSISLRDLISRYIFSSVTPQMNITNYTDYMIDKNNNGINDTLIFELTASNANGNFIFIIDLFDNGAVLVNETNRTLSSGANRLNISFDSIFLAQPQFNYSIKIYNASRSLNYRKDNIPTQNYQNYEKGFQISGINDARMNQSLKINITVNSSVNGTFETALFMAFNNSVISSTENKSLTDSSQYLIYNFDNETVKKTHHDGSFSISSLKIGKKTIKANPCDLGPTSGSKVLLEETAI